MPFSSASDSMFLVELVEIYSEGGTMFFTTYNTAATFTSFDYSTGATMSEFYYPIGYERGGLSWVMDNSAQSVTFKTAINDEIRNELNSYDIRLSNVVIKEVYSHDDFSNPNNFRVIYLGSIYSWEITNDILSISCRDNTINWYNKFPFRNYSYFCGHRFKGIKCSYTGLASSCNKTLTQCTTYGNEVHFGGFKEIPYLMRSRNSFG